MKNSKTWLFMVMIISVLLLLILALPNFILDPYFHFRKPSDKFVYSVPNFEERSINAGFIKQFEYDSVITGTSMTENFRTSEFNSLFNVNAIKIPYQSGSFYEVSENLEWAFKYKKVKLVLRSLDMDCMQFGKDYVRVSTVNYPHYLYDRNPFNDVNYLFNSEILFEKSIPMYKKYKNGEKGYFPNSDDCYNWGKTSVYGANIALGDRVDFTSSGKEFALSDKEKNEIIGNINQNIVSLAKKHPECQFYYFIPPFCAIWWAELYKDGELNKFLETEKIVIEMLLECENIKLYSFNTEFQLITNLYYYADYRHYRPEVNDFILRRISKGENLITKENYISYLEKEKSFYSTFDYNSLFDQIANRIIPCDLK